MKPVFWQTDKKPQAGL